MYNEKQENTACEFESLETKALRTIRRALDGLHQQVASTEKSLVDMQEQITVLEFLIVRLTQSSGDLQ